MGRVRALVGGEGGARDLLATLRIAALLFALANLAIGLAVAVLADAGASGLALAWLPAVAVAVWLLGGARAGRVGPALDLLGVAGLVVLGGRLGSASIGVALSAVAARALYDGGRLPAPSVGLVAAGAYASSLSLLGGEGASTALLSALPLVLVGVGLPEGAVALRSHQEAVERGRALHRAGTALLGAEDAPTIGGVTLEAAAALVRAHPHVRVAVSTVDGDDLVGVGSPDRPFGAFVPLDALAAADRETLAQGALVRVRGMTARPEGLVATPDRDKEVLLVPLAARQRLRGLVAVDPAPEHDPDGACDCVRLLQTLGGQAGMALEGVALTDDLTRSETRFRSLVQHSTDVIVLLDWHGRVRYVSPAVARVLGHAPATVTGEPFDALVHPDDVAAFRGTLQRVVDERVQAPIECRLSHRHRAWRHAEILATNLLGDPSVAGVVLNVRDVSERKLLEEELLHRAYHDPLTGIPNRTQFLERTTGALAGASSPDRVAVLFIDLDDFKIVNDSFGHAVGDGLLLAAAARLRELAPHAEAVARLAGDEFALLLEDVPSAEAAEAAAARVLARLCEPYRIGNQTLRVSASVGVALAGSSVEDAEDLLHRADLAMYSVKAGAKNGVTVLTADTDGPEGSRQLQADLQWAVLRSEFVVRYQPIVRIADGMVAAAEALVRWSHPVKGLLGPDAFISLAEGSDLIGDVFDHVLKDACRAGVSWLERRPAARPVGVSVNLSAVQLEQAQLVDQVTMALRASGLPPELLTLEITESVLVEDPHHAIQTLGTLKSLGVRIAVDDFGTGYSSLAYLRSLPIDILKIDRMFLAGIDSRDDAPLAPMIIDLGKRLAMPTVAEGVERRAQLEALRALGCDFAQGHLLSRPMAADRLGELLARDTQAV